MKNFLKVAMKKENIATMFTMILTAAMVFSPELALAGNTFGNIATILNDQYVAGVITFAFGLLAAYRVIMLFANFSPDGFFEKSITPAILVFLAFQWQTVIGWFGIR